MATVATYSSCFTVDTCGDIMFLSAEVDDFRFYRSALDAQQIHAVVLQGTLDVATDRTDAQLARIIAENVALKDDIAALKQYVGMIPPSSPSPPSLPPLLSSSRCTENTFTGTPGTYGGYAWCSNYQSGSHFLNTVDLQACFEYCIAQPGGCRYFAWYGARYRPSWSDYQKCYLFSSCGTLNQFTDNDGNYGRYFSCV